MTAPQLFRARFPFVCDRCDLGYKAGRLAGWDADHRMVCATCLLGADPDEDPTSQETTPCSHNTPATDSASTLFD